MIPDTGQKTGTTNQPSPCKQSHIFTAYHVIYPKTGKLLSYKQLRTGQKGYIWNEAACNEWGRLYKDWKGHIGLDVVTFVPKSDIPPDRKTTYI